LSQLWTDDGAREFLALHYPWFLDTWDAYPFPIQRADSIRYFILHHYGGIYLDMDTFCVSPFPLDVLDSDTTADLALFKSTLPTGITNDFMVSTARHPAFKLAIEQLPAYFQITRIWARLEPYCAIMISSGPFFITLVLKNYLLKLVSLPSPTVQVVTPPQLDPFITDLESSTWHRTDTQFIMWLGDRPWTWFALGGVGLCIGIYIFNFLLLRSYRILRNIPYATRNSKLAKLI
jgi:mannosyltransferase OCH1-like enzyme